MPDGRSYDAKITGRDPVTDIAVLKIPANNLPSANIAETAILKFSACFPDSVVGFIADNDKCDVRFVKYYIDFIKNNPLIAIVLIQLGRLAVGVSKGRWRVDDGR